MKISDARDSIQETNWITTHQQSTPLEREWVDHHTILHQTTKDGKGKYCSQRESPSFEKPRNLRRISFFKVRSNFAYQPKTCNLRNVEHETL
jgi:hypothetical protein